MFDLKREEEVRIKDVGPEEEAQGTGGGIGIEGLGPMDDTQGTGRDPSPGPSTRPGGPGDHSRAPGPAPQADTRGDHTYDTHPGGSRDQPAQAIFLPSPEIVYGTHIPTFTYIPWSCRPTYNKVKGLLLWNAAEKREGRMAAPRNVQQSNPPCCSQ